MAQAARSSKPAPKKTAPPVVPVAQKESKVAKDDKGKPENPFPNRSPAAGLEGGVEWLNTDGDISLKDLRGKVVLLDFWTFCCINCMHILPDLKYLEHKYKKQLVVIGVHSAKFENEKESENIRRAIVRYEIEHPVINDANMTVWRKFGVSSWPTLVLIDPEGYYCGYVPGEGQRQVLDEAIGKLVTYHRAKGTLDESPVRFGLERHKGQDTPLKFPGKLLADEKSNRLFISDSNHNRIVISDLDGHVTDVIGTGAIGAKNGDWKTATFDHPQGMALVGNKLYVADTENHLIREVDLDAKTVKTLAGTGVQGHLREPQGAANRVPLNSPWDLLEHKGTLFIAMAGPHQLWAIDLKSKDIRNFAGNGREDIRNGAHLDASFAQTSGMTTDGRYLYVVDSEGSAVRKVPIDGKGEVTTIVGTSDLPSGRSLFEFGDKDGVGSDARLQHPLGIVYHDDSLYVADSYNHKIKKIDLEDSSSKTWLGTGKRGNGLDPVQLSEPAGVTIARGKLYIADTNNHRILTADLDTKKTTELELSGLTPPPPMQLGHEDLEPSQQKVPHMSPQTITGSDGLKFDIKLRLPEGYKLNPEAPVVARLATEGGQELVADSALNERKELEVKDNVATLSLPLAHATGKGTFKLTVNYTICREGKGGLCKIRSQAWIIPVVAEENAKEKAISLTTKAE
jgi:thiol-disulfide isomerase/thioredoxin/sugar lactone lactonase YvrE